jgi:hypothetical protein
MVPWRDAGSFPRFQFVAEGYTPADGEENPHARFRVVAPRFFSVMGIPLIAGREFTDDDRRGEESVVIVSQSLADRVFPNGDALDRHVRWTDPLFVKFPTSRIVGVVADVDDENVAPQTMPTIYQAVPQIGVAGRLFVSTAGDPYAIVPAMRRIVHEIAPNQPVERAATLADVRAEKLTPQRVNAFVLSGFAGIALLIAVVGVAGVLTFSVSARTREFGVRLAVGASPRALLGGVLLEGTAIVSIGILAGAAGGYAFATLAAQYVESLRLPGGLPIAAAAAVLAGAAVLASLMPAARASRVDVLQALRSD